MIRHGSVVLALMLVLAGWSFAQEPQRNVDGSPLDTEAADSQSPEPAPEAARDEEAGKRRKRRQQSAVVGMLMLSLLCGVFLFVIFFFVLWARRIRQETLAPLPEQHPGDPLWYLKKPLAESAGDDAQPDGDDE